MKKILLIGGGGYIGTELTSLLLKNQFEVIVLDNFIYDHKIYNNSFLKNKNYSLFEFDLRELNTYKKIINTVDDVVILAGLVGDPITKKYPKLSKEINDIGLTNLIEYISDLENINHTIFISTCSNYGLSSSSSELNEASPLNPLSLYAKAKVSIEQSILNLNFKKNFHPTIFRFATAFGLSDRMRFDLTINEFIRDLYFGKELQVYDPETWRPYCHIKDFAEIILRSLFMPRETIAFEVFNAGSNKNNYSKKNIVEKILNYIPNGKISYVKGGFDKRNYVVNFDKLNKIFGYEPLINIEFAVNEIINFLKSNNYKESSLYGNFLIKSPLND